MTQGRPSAEDIDAPIEAPEGCLSIVGHELAFTAFAAFLAEQAMLFECDGKDVGDPAALAKLAAESTKARRAAAALAIEREKMVQLARLDRNKRAMRASSQRAPLRVMNGGQGH